MWGSSPVWLPPLYLSLQYGYTSSNTGEAFIESLPPLLLSWLVCLNNDTAMTSMMKIQLYKWGKKVKFLVLPSHQSRLCSLPDGCAIFMMAQRYFSGFPFFLLFLWRFTISKTFTRAVHVMMEGCFRPFSGILIKTLTAVNVIAGCLKFSSRTEKTSARDWCHGNHPSTYEILQGINSNREFSDKYEYATLLSDK